MVDQALAMKFVHMRQFGSFDEFKISYSIYSKVKVEQLLDYFSRTINRTIDGRKRQRTAYIMNEDFQNASPYAAHANASYQERPKARIDDLILKDPPHLLQHELLHLPNIFQNLLSILPFPNLALNLDLM